MGAEGKDETELMGENCCLQLTYVGIEILRQSLQPTQHLNSYSSYRLTPSKLGPKFV